MELNSKYIKEQVALKGVLPVYELSILDFLNSVKNATELAGTEPGHGPIFDDPNRGYSQGRPGYDLGETVAQRILDRRDELGGFTSLTDLANIPYFGVDKFNDLLYTFLNRRIPVPTGLGEQFDTFIAALAVLELDAKRRQKSNSEVISIIRKLIFGDEFPANIETVFLWDDVFPDAKNVQIPVEWQMSNHFLTAIRKVRENYTLKIAGREIAMNYVISGIEARQKSANVPKKFNSLPGESKLEVAVSHGFLANGVFQSLRDGIGKFANGYDPQAEILGPNYALLSGRDKIIAAADAYSIDYDSERSLTWNLLNYYTIKEGPIAHRFKTYTEKLGLGELVEGLFENDTVEFRTETNERLVATSFRLGAYNGFQSEMGKMVEEGNENPGAFAFRASSAYVLDRYFDDLALELGMETHKPNILSWNRLEPRPRTNDFKRTLRAEVRDALWFLSRQWQMGEFAAEDSGSAVEMRVDMETAKLKRYALQKQNAINYDPTIPMETIAEREPVHLDLSLRAEMGTHWLKLLENVLAASPGATPPADVSAILNDFKSDNSLWFTLPGPAENFPEVYSSADLKNWYASLAQGRMLDGGTLYEALDSGTLATTYVTSVVSGDVNARVTDAAGQFMAWFSKVYSQPGSPAETAWNSSHLEYQFQCSVPDGAGTSILTADEYASGHLDWYSFDLEKNSGKYPNSLKSGSTAGLVERRVSTILPGDLQFPGMPMARWWEFEDHKVDMGALRADTSEPGKLLLAEFALIYSNDWMLLPFRVPVGSISTVKNLIVKDVFGQYTSIEAAGAGDNTDWERWTMFNLYRRNNSQVKADTRLFIPPTVVKMLESEPLESVTFLRDEMANMVWGVETTIPDGMGSGKEGWDSARRLYDYLEEITPPAPVPATATNNANIQYKLGTTVPEHWIPFIPMRIGGVLSREIQLRRAAMPRLIPGRDPERVRPRTELLRTGFDPDTDTWSPYFIFEEEVPRSGAIVSRTWQRTRWMDGEVITWLGRRKKNGRGEANSGLQFDKIEDR